MMQVEKHYSMFLKLALQIAKMILHGIIRFLSVVWTMMLKAAKRWFRQAMLIALIGKFSTNSTTRMRTAR